MTWKAGLRWVSAKANGFLMLFPQPPRDMRYLLAQPSSEKTPAFRQKKKVGGPSEWAKTTSQFCGNQNVEINVQLMSSGTSSSGRERRSKSKVDVWGFSSTSSSPFLSSHKGGEEESESTSKNFQVALAALLLICIPSFFSFFLFFLFLFLSSTTQKEGKISHWLIVSQCSATPTIPSIIEFSST